MNSFTAIPGAVQGVTQGHLSGDTFIFPLRVFYEDTDAAGIVYYANYLKFIERARTEMLRAAGIDHSGIRETHGVLFVVRRCALDYRQPARLDDVLDIHTRIVAVKGASLEAEQIVMRDGKTLVHADLLLACMNEKGAPVRFPPNLRTALEALRQG
ncbi:MAG: tol-pal system-associated acyl-CoA thioesterase [Rhodospirillaceae bacterium]|nr:tol-pal system-associated acyl-CoA thioesterase [Rhodospirillaceae bacterium]MBT5039436.1 tol-pal system-associated acyl-CoA thioesterase [Rhodospirillaceae bacterium]MBT7290960.1 tol-pal system-associated acyl-CoA thioesterase [Rhodospirillaceae bacterium]